MRRQFWAMGIEHVKKVSSVALAILIALGLSSCAAVNNPEVRNKGFWANGPLFNAKEDADLGLAALAKGDNLKAEASFNQALEKDPRNVDALLGLAMVYQTSGRSTKAREMYEAVLNQPNAQYTQMAAWNDLTPRTASQIASANLNQLNGNPGGALALNPNPVRGAPVPAGPPPIPGVQSAAMPAQQMPMQQASIAAMPMGQAMFGRTAPLPGASASQEAEMPRFADADSNIVSRFRTMKMLLDQGLITQDEFATRRKANLGALLPISEAPPSAGLDRPVPSPEQVSGRLRAIGRALEMRAMTASQQSAERSMILDALMPGSVNVKANAPPLPTGMMEGADAVRRLEMLKSASLINDTEYGKEKSSIDAAMQPKAPPAPVAAVDQEKAAPPASASAGPQPAVHLASLRTQDAAEKGWASLRRAYGKLLGDLKADYQKIDLPGKGTFYRIVAGPLKSPQDAQSLCRQLKAARHNFCEPATTTG
jgi:tetratricopeptide (TPR) repeat protein